MVFDSDFSEAVIDGDVDLVETWLQSLERPEDINAVDENGNTVLNLLAHGFYEDERHNLRGMKMVLSVVRPVVPVVPRVALAAGL